MWIVLKSKIKKYEKTLLILLGSASLSSLLVSLDFNLLEANLYDLRFSASIPSATDSRIVLITLDDHSAQALDDLAPLSFQHHVRMIEALGSYQPKAVGYLVDFNKVRQYYPDEFSDSFTKRFIQATKKLETNGTHVLLATYLDSAASGEAAPPYPLNSIRYALATLHKDGNVFSQDRVTRRAITFINGQPSFHSLIATELRPDLLAQSIQSNYYVPEIDAWYFFFKYRKNTASPIEHYGYPNYRFSDLLEGKVSAEALKDKIILIDTLAKKDSGDFALTPYSKVGFKNPKILIHANIIDSLIQNDGIVREPSWVNWIITFSLTSFVIGWVLGSTPLYGVFATLFLAILFFIINLYLFQKHSLWIKESQPLVGIFVGYYLTVPYRLIREYKKRWDYQKKNELLTEVEELKRNFLSFITHDLKTPVARIQGLTELILRKGQGKNEILLMEKDVDTLRHILRSTEELNHFISTILDISKFESSQLSLNLESKDVNQLIEQSVERFKTHLNNKNLSIKLDLDPLFPIKIDGALISKAINNLIDNAIKYSPARSTIRIKSLEEHNKIIVSISDEGIGMSEDELRGLFSRFYRAKNDATVNISGTGLGLYLSKYFVEAHQGAIVVESTRGKGSTFKIILPVATDFVLKGLTLSTPNSIKNSKESSHV
jgi:signal transduction histidine kinase